MSKPSDLGCSCDPPPRAWMYMGPHHDTECPLWAEFKVVDHVWINPQQRIQCHTMHSCKGPCPVHQPSDHSMRGFRLIWRDDRSIFERVCEHGVGHPDPDMIEYRRQRGDSEADMRVLSCHGCDGCCAGEGPDAQAEIEQIILWSNGVISVFDTTGEQMGELQGPRITAARKIHEYLEKHPHRVKPKGFIGVWGQGTLPCNYDTLIYSSGWMTPEPAV